MFGERVVSVLTLTVVLSAGVCSPAPPPPLHHHLHLPGDYGVKLCGRQFIRAVIFTCGGSRWRRTFEEVHWRDRSAANTFNTRSLEDILSTPLILYLQAAQDHPAHSTASSTWRRRKRRRRQLSLGVAGICCSEGCTKNDIGRLC
ncbi:prorelaxin H1 [Entelurus aequoreus]|uniref:prorelaxin H1 n=1 Tax=Entelurus aequoreus TaxID=161455 RepID=UPI002B1DBF39|nr:prorelaxin H1 [Entelurus aequoreus]